MDVPSHEGDVPAEESPRGQNEPVEGGVTDPPPWRGAWTRRKPSFEII